MEPQLNLPPKPEEPLDSECCGTGCSPCVFDIYKDKLARWESNCEAIQSGQIDTVEASSEDLISPYDYKEFSVTAIYPDCCSCKIIYFQRTNFTASFNSRSFPVQLGQHVLLRIEGKSRQYTILDVTKQGAFVILFKIYPTGVLTPLVDKLVVGDKVEIRGPFGTPISYVANKYKTLVLIAAGTGIAPFGRLIDRVLQNDSDETRILLLFACRNENEVMLVNKIKEWSRCWNFQVKYFISNGQDLKDGQSFHYGAEILPQRIDKTVILGLEQIKVENVLYFVCGTKSFDKDILNYLKLAGLSEERINLF